MSTPIVATKLYRPLSRPRRVERPLLLDRLTGGLHRKLSLISAPAGFGKTTIVGAWAAECPCPVAWLSLDEGDGDPARFLAYVVAAIQQIAPQVGQGMVAALRSPQPPPAQALAATLLNEVAAISTPFVLVLDDYHRVDAGPVDELLTFWLDHLPPQMHMVIATREDPSLPLHRLRARDELTELRAAELRFSPTEAAEFLNGVMGLALSEPHIAALESRTEGWIAGLQLAAVSLQQHPDPAGMIESFTGSHRFIMDYLLEEVLRRQPEHIQRFLLATSILDRLCGPLCEAVLDLPHISGQAILESLEQANLFIVPLDGERRWYRYHHLFAELLRRRFEHQLSTTPRTAPGIVPDNAPSVDSGHSTIADYHTRAAIWYEENGLAIDAFLHAATANDPARAERLIEGNGMPLHFRGGVAPILNWLESLPPSVLDATPSLWTTFASVLLVTGQIARVEPTLQAAEIALEPLPPDPKTRDLIGRVAAIRATLAATLKQVETLVHQSQRALEYLHPQNLAFRTSTAWKLGYAYHLTGDRPAARQAYEQVIAIGQASGNTIFTIMATIGLGALAEIDTRLPEAASTFRRSLEMFGEHPLPSGGEAYLGLARIAYEWNDLDAALEHAQRGGHLFQQMESADRFIDCDLLFARLKLAQGDAPGARAMLAETAQLARARNLHHRLPKIAAMQVVALLHEQGRQADWQRAATDLLHGYDLPLSLARVRLAQGDGPGAWHVLETAHRRAEEKGWADEQLQALVLMAMACHAQADATRAHSILHAALTAAAPGGYIRTFVDQGPPMFELLSEAAAQGIMADYVGKLLAAFAADTAGDPAASARDAALSNLLTAREVEVLRLIARGLSNREIGEELFLALDTVKGHNRSLFGKLQVQRRTEAVARARKLGLL